MANSVQIQVSDEILPLKIQNRLIEAGHSQISAIGNPAILQNPLVAFFCSTKCTGEAVLSTFEAVRNLRDAGVTLIGGFHSPMEMECLDLLLRGTQPIVVCPARSITKYRHPSAWKSPIEQNRLLVLSTFPPSQKSPTAKQCELRNELVAALADSIFVAHAAAGSRTEALCLRFAATKNTVQLERSANSRLQQAGVRSISAGQISECL